jgi:hypothetical protein
VKGIRRPESIQCAYLGCAIHDRGINVEDQQFRVCEEPGRTAATWPDRSGEVGPSGISRRDRIEVTPTPSRLSRTFWMCFLTASLRLEEDSTL